ncbi:MAG: hypothetical protein JXB49_03975 [Bacteroidales bacterium]|nr:hypothetical protein [Bacteroidales bacterium]
MKKNLYFLPGFIIILIIASSCAPAYVPNVVNTPMLSNKGDTKIAIHGGTAGFNPQFAIGITDNIGLMVNGSFADRTSDSTDNFHKHQFAELGIGYYKKLGRIGRFETFGGCGYGKVKAYYDNAIWEDYANTEYIRAFLQPSIGLTTKVIDFSLTPRFVMVNLTQSGHKDIGYFAEPVVTTKLGYEYFKITSQLGFSFPLNLSHIDFDYAPMIFAVGMQINIGRKYDEKNKGKAD